MNFNSDNKLSPKEYLFLVVCLIIFFTVSIFLMGYGAFPKGNELMITGIAVVIAIPLVIYVLKNIEF